jgi:hypothetical protein
MVSTAKHQTNAVRTTNHSLLENHHGCSDFAFARSKRNSAGTPRDGNTRIVAGS